MASEIRVNTINNSSGLGTITISDTGHVFSGITTIGSVTIDGGTVTGNLTGDVTGNVSGIVTSTGISTFSDTVNVGAGKSIRLYGASSGYSEIVAADGSASTTFTLPANGGSASQYLQTDGSGVLSWQTVATPTVAFDAYAIIVDQKSATTDGGTFTSGDWRTRDLNTELSDPDGIVSISSNQFTLAAGSYLIRWACPGFNVERHQSRLYDVTNTTVREYGLSCYSAAGGYAQTHSFGSSRVVPSASTTYEIQHHSSYTQATNGMGVHGGAGVEQYTLVEIFREA